MSTEIKYLPLENPYVGYYSTGLHFAFLSEKNEQASMLSSTKAFLQDATLAFLQKREMVSYNPKENPPLDLKHTRILLAHFKQDKDTFMRRMENLMDFLHQVETSLGFDKSTFEIVENTPSKTSENLPVVVIIGDKRWMGAPPLISMYTLFIRACLSHVAGTKWHETLKGIIDGKIKVDYEPDVAYLKIASETINKLILVGTRAFFYSKIERNYPKEASNNLIHSAGIVAMAQKQTKPIVSRWTSPRANRIAARYCRRFKPEIFKAHYPEGVPVKKDSKKDSKDKAKAKPKSKNNIF